MKYMKSIVALLLIVSVGGVQARKAQHIRKRSASSMGQLRSPGIEQSCKTAEGEKKVRKFKVSKFLHGIAKTCEEVGNAVNAKTHKDKQQAACNIISSLLSVAANAAQDKEEQRAEQALGADDNNDEKRSIEAGDNCCLSNQALFRKICLMDDDDREKAIELAFRSGFFSREFLWELFTSVKETFVENSQVILEFVKEKIDYISGHAHEKRDRSDDEEWEEDEEVADEVLMLLAAFWNFLLEVSHEKDAEQYLRGQFSALMDFIYTRIFGYAPPLSHDTSVQPEEEKIDEASQQEVESQGAPSEEPANAA